MSAPPPRTSTRCEIELRVKGVAGEALSYPFKDVQVRGLRDAGVFKAQLCVKSVRHGGNWFYPALMCWMELDRLVGANDTQGLIDYIKAEVKARQEAKTRDAG